MLSDDIRSVDVVGGWLGTFAMCNMQLALGVLIDLGTHSIAGWAFFIIRYMVLVMKISIFHDGLGSDDVLPRSRWAGLAVHVVRRLGTFAVFMSRPGRRFSIVDTNSLWSRALSIRAALRFPYLGSCHCVTNDSPVSTSTCSRAELFRPIHHRGFRSRHCLITVGNMQRYNDTRWDKDTPLLKRFIKASTEWQMASHSAFALFHLLHPISGL
jgi:hypothetical protein